MPTDVKLAKKVINHCSRSARRRQVYQCYNYNKISKHLLRGSYFGHHPRCAKKTQKARKKTDMMREALVIG